MHTKNRQLAKRVLLALGLTAIFIYGYYEFRGFLYGPELVIESPISGSSFTSPVIDVVGYTKRITKISLNENPIFVDEEGLFSQRIPLVPGHNFLTMSVEDRFGNVKTEAVEVIYTPDNPPPRIEISTSTPVVIDEEATTSPELEF